MTSEQQEAVLRVAMDGFFDPDWYVTRYPDVATAQLEPLLHFIRFGAAERRDPNRFFDSAWYLEHYPDVGASGAHPLLHYLSTGARELRNPHPRFDAAWYVDQYPDAAANPLVYHLRTGIQRGYLTERPVDITQYLPSKQRPPRPPANRLADIVIPVYKGLAETRTCLQSVLASREKPLGDIIVVDDRSPDPQLAAYLDQLAACGQIRLLRNRRNLGFVRSVNIGMQAAGTHDVVLLNSDTEVPSGWLPRLAAQAYRTDRIASVSPMSNNATICGYPDNEGHPLPDGVDLATIDSLSRTANAGRFIGTPTTVGFCMYIRRDALADAGLFDAERFGLGYGEENDFCLRTSARGWRHHIACDIFVYHKGSVSFGDRAQAMAKRAMQRLLARHPTYTRDVARHVAADAIAPARFALTAALFRRSARPVILMVTHDLGGGVRQHIDTLIRRLQTRAHVLLLEGTDRGVRLSVPAGGAHPTLTLPADRMDDLTALLRSAAVSRVHVHHLLGIDLDVRALIRRLDVPFDTTVHDYFAICPQINLLHWRHSLYCGEPAAAACNRCIANRASNGARDILSWRAEHKWVFTDAARVLCPSQDVIARLQRHGLADRAVYAPHEPVEPGPWPLRIPDLNGKLRIAFLGTLVDHKGGRTVASVAEMMDPARTEIHLIGDIDGPFPAAARKRLRITGRYDQRDLPTLIARADPHVIWFPAAWPETFSYTTSEAIQAGVAIAATRIGSMAERLAGRPYTWLTEIATTPAAWLALFETIRQSLTVPAPSIPPSIPPRAAVADFYAHAYLQPQAARPRRGRRPLILVIPERYAYGYPTPAAFQRLLLPLHHAQITGDGEIVVTDAAGALTHEADLIVTQRAAVPDIKATNALAAHASRTGARLVYDLDADLPRQSGAKVVRRMLELADTVWVATDALTALRPDAIVLADRLDETIWTHHSPPVPNNDDPLRILWMASSTRDAEFALIQPALCRLKDEYGERVTIDVCGVTSRVTLPKGLSRLAPSLHAGQSYPGFVDWLTRRQPSWHIGLAPLLDRKTDRAAAATQALEYAALGLLTLASDIPVFRGSIADGPAGRLVANTAHAWYAALDHLLRDRDRRRALAATARAAFLMHGTLASQAPLRREAWLRALPQAPHRTDTAA